VNVFSNAATPTAIPSTIDIAAPQKPADATTQGARFAAELSALTDGAAGAVSAADSAAAAVAAGGGDIAAAAVARAKAAVALAIASAAATRVSQAVNSLLQTQV